MNVRALRIALLSMTLGCAQTTDRDDAAPDVAVHDAAAPIDATRVDAARTDAFVPADVGLDAHRAAETSLDTNRVCVETCASDAECAASCPPGPGTPCCDSLSGRCYWIGGSCIVPPDAGPIDAAGVCLATCTRDADCAGCEAMKELAPCCDHRTGTCDYHSFFSACPGTPLDDAGVPPAGFCAIACSTHDDCWSECPYAPGAIRCCSGASHTCEYVPGFGGCPRPPDAGL